VGEDAPIADCPTEFADEDVSARGELRLAVVTVRPLVVVPSRARRNDRALRRPQDGNSLRRVHFSPVSEVRAIAGRATQSLLRMH